MTASDWQEHATKCRQVALTIEDVVARRILLEAADDYLAMAAHEAEPGDLNIPAYQAAAVANANSSFRARR